MSRKRHTRGNRCCSDLLHPRFRYISQLSKARRQRSNPLNEENERHSIGLQRAFQVAIANCERRIGRQQPNSIRPAEMLPWLGFDRVQPNRLFSRGSIIESMHGMVLHRPVQLAMRNRANENSRFTSTKLFHIFPFVKMASQNTAALNQPEIFCRIVVPPPSPAKNVQ